MQVLRLSLQQNNQHKNRKLFSFSQYNVLKINKKHSSII